MKGRNVCCVYFSIRDKLVLQLAKKSEAVEQSWVKYGLQLTAIQVDCISYIITYTHAGLPTSLFDGAKFMIS